MRSIARNRFEIFLLDSLPSSHILDGEDQLNCLKMWSGLLEVEHAESMTWGGDQRRRSSKILRTRPQLVMK